MAIDNSQLKTELGNFFRTNNKAIRAAVYQEPQLAKYAKKITKVKGRYPAIHSVTNHVVQGFEAVWNAVGTTKIKVNELVAYHQKVNFAIVPSNMENSWLAELNDKNKSFIERPISQYIWENELKPKVVSDIEDLMVNGQYDANDLGTYGKSMNGLLTILNNGINSSDNPMYRIRLSAEPSDSNVVDVITEFERKVPSEVNKGINRVFMSTQNLYKYILRYEELYGAVQTFTDGKKVRSRLAGRELIGIDAMNGSNIIFATPDENFLLLVDDENGPALTNIQEQDYTLKLFMEWWLGVGFHTNQYVLVSTYSGEGSGLSSDNEFYFT